MAVFSLTFFGWIWAISTELNRLLAKDSELNITRFKLIFSIAITYVTTINLFLLFPEYLKFPETTLFSVVLIPIHLISLLSILYGCRFAGRTIKSLELGRTATHTESHREYGQVAILFIGIWTLQPKLNKIIRDDGYIINKLPKKDWRNERTNELVVIPYKICCDAQSLSVLPNWTNGVHEVNPNNCQINRQYPHKTPLCKPEIDDYF